MTLFATDPTEMLGGVPSDSGYTGTRGQVSNPLVAPGTTNPGAGTVNTAATEKTAVGVIQNILSEFGLGSATTNDGNGNQISLAQWAWNQVTSSGIDPTTVDPTALTDDVMTQIQSTDAFKQRFPGIAQQMAAGENPTTPTDYINWEDTAQGLATQYGLNYSAIFTPDVVAKNITDGVSASELQNRFNTYVDAYNSAPPEVQQAYDQFYGVNGLTAFVASIATPGLSDDQLKQNIEAAQVQGAGATLGLNVGQARSTKLAQMGVSYGSALTALQKVTAESGLYTPTVGETASSQGPGATKAVTANNQGIDAALGLSATAEQQVDQEKEERQNAFKGGGGAAISEAAGGGAYGAGVANSA